MKWGMIVIETDQRIIYVRFQVLTAASMKFRIVFCDDSSLMMEAARTSETSVDNYFTWQYIPEDNSELRKNNLLLKQISY
jgi:hypothetical protein